MKTITSLNNRTAKGPLHQRKMIERIENNTSASGDAGRIILEEADGTALHISEEADGTALHILEEADGTALQTVPCIHRYCITLCYTALHIVQYTRQGELYEATFA